MKTDIDFTEELKTLYNAIEVLGSRGVVKIAQWVRGSTLSWTDKYNRVCGHNEEWWRLFIRKCHVLGTANKQLKSIIKVSIIVYKVLFAQLLRDPISYKMVRNLPSPQ